MRRFVWLVVGLCLVLPVMAQVDSTPTPNLTETFTPTLTPAFTPTMTFTPSPTPTLTPTAETTATIVPSVTPEVTEEATAEVTDVVQPTVEATAEVTVEITENVVVPEVTIQITELITEAVVEVTEEVTVEVTQSVEVTQEATVEVTELVEVTEEVTAEVTEAATPEILYTATPGGIALRYVQGVVTYQNRSTSAGISVMVWSQADVLLSVATTNEQGIYSVPVPSEEPYWLVFNGQLHQEVRVWMEVTQAVPGIVLFGGDLDGDGCIGQNDLNILIRNYNQPGTLESDITADGITNLSDLAILTGNYQACDVESPSLSEEDIPTEATAEITPEVEGTVEAESTETGADVTDITASPTVEVTEEVAQP